MTPKRSGNTVKVSVSIDREDLAVLRKYARAAHHGNLSAAFAEAAKWIRQRKARQWLIQRLGGPILTDQASTAIDAEQRPKKSRPGRAA